MKISLYVFDVVINVQFCPVLDKWRTQNTFFGLVLELVLKFAILVLNISTKMAFSQNTLQST